MCRATILFLLNINDRVRVSFCFCSTVFGRKSRFVDADAVNSTSAIQAVTDLVRKSSGSLILKFSVRKCCYAQTCLCATRLAVHTTDKVVLVHSNRNHLLMILPICF